MTRLEAEEETPKHHGAMVVIFTNLAFKHCDPFLVARLFWMQAPALPRAGACLRSIGEKDQRRMLWQQEALQSVHRA